MSARPIVVANLDDGAEHRDRPIPVPDVQHRDRDAGVAAHVAQTQPFEVHVDEDPAVVPVVPGRSRIRRPVGADGRDDCSMRLLQELDDLVGQRRERHERSLGRERDRTALVGRPVERLDRAGLSERVVTAEQRLRATANSSAHVLELQPVRVHRLELDSLGAVIPPHFEHRRPAVPGVVQEDRPLLADRLELVAHGQDEPAVDLGQDIARESAAFP